MSRTRLKVCCIGSVGEAATAVAAGADALGLVGRMPTGPGPIDDDVIAAIAPRVAPGVSRWLLTSETAADAIVSHARRTRVDTVQLIDDMIDAPTRRAVRDAAPALRVVQVIHVVDAGSVDLALAAADTSDALLLDSGDPSRRELGGTGRVHDWALSRAIVDGASVPVFLAGGLTPDNVAEAVAAVRPFGVDLCSGVRTDGALDADLLARFVAALRSA